MVLKTGTITQHKKHYVLPWGPWTALIVAFAAYFAAQISMFLPLAAWGVFNPGEPIESSIGSSTWFNLVLTGFSSLILILVLWLFLKYKKTGFSSLGFSKFIKKDFLWIIIGIAIYLALTSTALLAASFIPNFDVNQAQNVGYGSARGWQLLLAFVGLVVIPPVAEEMLFRGFLYRGLATKWPKILSALIASSLFALVHLQWNVAVDVFVLSLVMIFILEKTQNLWVCIILHSIKNFMAFLVLFVFAIK
jgi:membrane protease YdiL (CAAX protease family)